MNEFQYVAQKTRTSCGIAAVAMLAGTSFEAAGRAIGKIGLTRTRDVVKGLRSLGVACSGKLKRIRSTSELPARCLAKVTWDDKRGHWIVVLGGVVFDPDDSLQSETVYQHGKITSYLPLE